MSVLGYPSQFPFSPARKIKDTDWNQVIDNLTGSQVKSGSLFLSAPNNLTVGGNTTLGNINISGSINPTTGSLGIINSAYITSALNVGGALTANSITSPGSLSAGTITTNALTAGNFFVPGGAITTITSGSMIVTGPMTGSNINASNVSLNNLTITGSIIANNGTIINTGSVLALPASYIIFSGSVAGYSGSFF